MPNCGICDDNGRRCAAQGKSCPYGYNKDKKK